MTARFAGAQDLAQRRRRRLAQEAMGESSRPGMSRQSRSAAELPTSSPEPVVAPPPRAAGDTMIPGNWWAISGLGLLGLAAWGLVVWLGISSWSNEWGISELVTLDQGAVPRFFSTVALLMTAQLSLLIFWHRSRSRKDFLGRYRIWGWTGFFFGMLCVANATHCHLPLLDYAMARSNINCWRGDQLYWFVPLAIGVLSVYRLVAREVNPSRPSTVTWNVAFGLALLVCGLHYGLELLIPVSSRAAVIAAVTLLWHYSLALACLVHARYVTHVTNEAGVKRLSAGSRMSRWLVLHATRVGEALLGLATPVHGLWHGWRTSRAQKASTPKPKKSKPKREAPGEAKVPAASERVPPRVLAKSTVKSVQTTPEKPAGPATPAAPRVSWGDRLQGTLFRRWVRREDSAAAGVPAPHTPTVKPAEPARKSAPPVAAAPTKSPARELPAALRNNADDQHDDAGEAGSTGGLSSRERKKLKKLQRQQART